MDREEWQSSYEFADAFLQEAHDQKKKLRIRRTLSRPNLTSRRLGTVGFG